MDFLTRLRRKINSALRYQALASDWRSSWSLLVLGLWRNRLLPRAVAVVLSGNAILTPRLRITRGERIRIVLGDAEERDCCDELFLDRIYQPEPVPFAPAWAVDCGAFRGYFCAPAVCAFPSAQFACFEANPAHYPALKHQLSLLSRPVDLVEAAAGIREGRAHFSGTGM